MLKKTLLLNFALSISISLCYSQNIGLTAKLMERKGRNPNMGSLVIYQDPSIDSLIYRYILYNERLNGLEGFRIQIYSSSDRNAKEQSGKVSADFMSKFPDIVTYPPIFDRPSYYKVRVGNYRTRVEGTKYLLMIRKVYPDAYLVPDIINFPDLNKK
jgi:hypothetical protein